MALLGLAALGGGAFAEAAGEAPVYGAVVVCNAGMKRPARICSLAAEPRAVFRAFRRDGVTYRVCVRKPGAPVRCRLKKTGRRGRRSPAAISLVRPGPHIVVWRVGGKRVRRRGFYVRAPRVFVNGDSLAVGTRPYLPRALAGWHVRQSASISRQAGEGAAVLRAQGERLARIVFISLGTNGSAGATAYFRSSIRAVMHVAGPQRCVVWANIVRPGAYERLNAVLARENRRRRNLLVYDWARVARAHPEWFGSDGVHPTATGYRVRAAGIARQIRRCLEL